MTPIVQIEVCGALIVTVDGERREDLIHQQGRLLLAFLAVMRARPVSRDELALAVWGDDDGAGRRAAVSTLLSRLRRVLGADAIESKGRASVQLAEHVVVDHDALDNAITQSAALLRASAAREAAGAARLALDMAQRGLMHGESAAWLDERRRDLAERGLRARELIAEASLMLGDAELHTAIDCAREIVRSEPYRESAHSVLIRALEQQGNTAQALEVYEQLRRRLSDDLGATPGPQLRAVHTALLGAPQRHATPKTTGAPPAPRRTRSSPSRARTPFVGREEELAALRNLFDPQAGASCRLALLEGEPGIGKTRLAMQFADDCRRRGGVALYGRCDSDTVVPYQPFVEALRHARDDGAFDDPPDSLRGHVSELARVLPELGDSTDVSAPSLSGPSDDGTERFRLFGAVSAVLSELARARPALLILDDLQWADKPTLLMLRQVVRSADDTQLLVLGTYRDSERASAVLDTVADLRREHVLERLSLRGLSEHDATQMIERASEADVSSALGRTLWEECRGNPFFLEEMLRHRARGGDGQRAPGAAGDSLPDAVKDVIGRRLASASKAVRRILEIACVVGSEFSVEILEELAEMSEDELDAALREAIDAHLVEELPGAYGRCAFEHNLTRQTLYEDLTFTRRARIHLRVAEVIERLDGQRDGRRLAELAHHFLHAPPERGRAKAAHYAVGAAAHAMQILAYEEAVRLYELALEALGEDLHAGESHHDLLLALGEARVKAGDTRRARVSFREAGDSQRRSALRSASPRRRWGQRRSREASLTTSGSAASKRHSTGSAMTIGYFDRDCSRAW